MTYRRKHGLAILAVSAFIVPMFAACTDSATAPEVKVPERRAYITQPTGKRLCPVDYNDPYHYDYDGYYYDDPQEPVDDLCVYQPPLEPVVVDRPVFYDTYTASVEVDNRNESSLETLAYYEQQQGYQSLRAYLDPNEWYAGSADANGNTLDATGSEGAAWVNDGVVREDFNMADGILSLLNNKGEMQIGDSIYKLTRDNAYMVHVNDLALLRQLVPRLSSPAPASDPRIVQAPVETTVTPEEEEVLTRVAASGDASFSLGFVTDNCWWRVGDRRMHGKSYITNALVYSEAGVKTEWERKKWLGWSNTGQSGTMEASFTSSSLRKGNDYIFPTSGTKFETGTSQVKKVIATAWFRRILGTINGTHTSSVGQCYTRVSRS